LDGATHLDCARITRSSRCSSSPLIPEAAYREDTLLCSRLDRRNCCALEVLKASGGEDIATSGESAGSLAFCAQRYIYISNQLTIAFAMGSLVDT
jgi:hypothetical protein